ncbi:hypothetical protein BLOT_008433 [Blomia tropicalis]|nr:hypothetical protein BLOT_008433 [Blomia tropicalis]
MIIIIPIFIILITHIIHQCESYDFDYERDSRQIFTDTIKEHGYDLEEHHVVNEDDSIVSIFRVVPRSYNTSTYNIHREPILILNGIITESLVYYVRPQFLQHNRSFCGEHFALCLLQTQRYDLWIINSANDQFDDRSKTKYIPFPGGSESETNFWCSSLQSFSRQDLKRIFHLMRLHTKTSTIIYIGYIRAVQSMFALLSVQDRNDKYLNPFILSSGSEFLGRSKQVVGATRSVIRKVPGVYLPSQILSKFLSNIGQIGANNKICAILTLKNRLPNRTTMMTNWREKLKGSHRYVAVNFDVIMIYGQEQWISMLLTIEQLVDVLRSFGENVVEFGCLRPGRSRQFSFA